MKAEVFEAIKALFLFRPFTDYPRVLEIALGLQAWADLVILIWSITIIINETL